MKWAAAVGLAIFITFAIFSIVIFSSISNILLHKEVDNVHDTVTVIQQRLGRPEKTLTSEFVAEQLDPAPRDSKAILKPPRPANKSIKVMLLRLFSLLLIMNKLL